MHGSKKVPYVIPAQAGIHSMRHPEFISGYTIKRCAKLVQHDYNFSRIPACAGMTSNTL
ncbi:hypothetical protein [Rickettsia endosymbiont of Orchestes rusci]|uniref:hypothetical protein n=1 Tax=Rickettsia endosymbiont of Orchestes rusci TaxID=3066250 RepID=UPI00313D64B9